MDGNPFSGEMGWKIPANGRRIGGEAYDSWEETEWRIFFAYLLRK